jgi:pyruvyltransferase
MDCGDLCTKDLAACGVGEVNNFGDRLGPALFHQISGRPVYVEARGLEPTFQGPAREIHCFLGTLAHLLEGPHHFILWGLGTSPPHGPAHHGCRPMRPGLDLEIRALRGPLTRQVLVEAGYRVLDGIPYGDPGLLIPAFYERSPLQTEDFCLIPHHSDHDEWRWLWPGFNVIDIRTPTYESLQALILEVTKYRVIFTSSLHITILAESFGIPVQPIVPKLSFKFDDFYGGVGKSVDYLLGLSSQTDWLSLCDSTIRNWKPIRWNPQPWLDAAPFPVSEAVSESLLRHYHNLAKSRSRIWHFAGPRSPSKSFVSPRLRDHYNRVIASFRHEPDVESTAPRLVVKVFSPKEWIIYGAGDLPVMETTVDGMILNAEPIVRHAATEFFPVQNSQEALFRVPLQSIDGDIEILVQNARYVTQASLFVRRGEAPGPRELAAVPIGESECLRLCVQILSGRVKLGSVELSLRQPCG